MTATARTLSPASSRRELFKLALAERTDPEAFYEALATATVARFPFELRGRRILDLGSGPGYFAAALRHVGATVLSVDCDPGELGAGAVAGDACRLPLPDAAVDGVFCSNLLEHTPAPREVLREIARVLEPGGWGWISWTNWFSPWGGHEITPFHYLGPRAGLSLYRRLRGEPRKNLPGVGLFPLHIGATLRIVRDQPDLHLLDCYPRYYPSQRWIVRIPGLREVLTWNCVLLVEKVADG
jgi:SAM-dependent methyltransferase